MAKYTAPSAGSESRSKETVIAIDSGQAIDSEQQEAQRKRLEKVAKVSCGTCLSLSVSIITAGVANKNKSGGGDLIFFKASVALALISFFTGFALLISVLLYKNVKRTILLGQIIVAVFSVLAGVVVLAISVFV